MNKTMHYWHTFAIFAEAGWKDALLIARACYQVDWSTPKNVRAVIEAGHALPVITQIYDYAWFRGRTHWDPHAEIWTRWHYGGRHCHSHARPCKKDDGKFAVEMGIYGPTVRPPVRDSGQGTWHMDIRLGANLHTWQDSYSHQGFCGWRDPRNSRGKWWDFGVPDIGHAEFGTRPDEIDAVWKNQHGTRIINRDRFLECAWTLWALIKPGRGLSAEPDSIRAIREKRAPKDRIRDFQAIIRGAGQEPVDFKPFLPGTNEWRVFCEVCR